MRREAEKQAIAEFEEEIKRQKDKIILDTNFNPYRKVETLNRS